MTSPAALAWFDLLSFPEPEDERGAFELHERGVRDLADQATWPVVASVLADLLGHPIDVIDGEWIV